MTHDAAKLAAIVASSLVLATAGVARADAMWLAPPDEECPPGSEWALGHGEPYCLAGDLEGDDDALPSGGACAWYRVRWQGSLCEETFEYGRDDELHHVARGPCDDGCPGGSVCRDVDYCERRLIGRGIAQADALGRGLGEFPLRGWPFPIVAIVAVVVRRVGRRKSTDDRPWDRAAWIALVVGTISLALWAYVHQVGWGWPQQLSALASLVFEVVSLAVPLSVVLRVVASLRDRESTPLPRRRMVAWVVVWLPVLAVSAFAMAHTRPWSAAPLIQLGATLSVTALCAASLGRWAGALGRSGPG